MGERIWKFPLVAIKFMIFSVFRDFFVLYVRSFRIRKININFRFSCLGHGSGDISLALVLVPRPHSLEK
jgi:hypothetical protein